MDPTAPKDNNNNQGTNPPSPSPIQPGQFVVAPREDITPPPPSEPEQPPQESPQPSQPASPAKRGEFTQPPASPGESLGGPSPKEPAPSKEPAPLFAQDQPNPTPFVAPTPPPEMAQEKDTPPPSKIQRARKILIIVGILLLVAILGAIVWLFIVGRSREQPAKTQSQEVSTSQEPSQPPIPKRTTGGFADLPAATRESQATASASPKTQ